MSGEEWVQSEIVRLTAAHGAVPPPWVAFPDTHPYDICWRMGNGEAYLDVVHTWLDQQRATQRFDEAARIAYFRRWPPPPRWLCWMIDVIWDVEHQDDEEDGGEAACSPYFARAEALGFGTRADYQKDMDDPKWLEE